MRHLMLLRHAKTERDSPTGSDRDRQLTATGKADAAELGRYVATHAQIPDFALVSPAARARETWELFAAEFPVKLPHEFVPDLYGANPVQLLQIARTATLLSDRASIDRLLIVAHNPGLHELALALTKNGNARDREILLDNLPTCGLATIKFTIADWAELSFATGCLEQLVSPALLRRKSEGG